MNSTLMIARFSSRLTRSTLGCVPWIEHWFGWGAVLLVFGGMYIGAAVCWLLLRTGGTVFDQSLVRAKLGDQS